jgi:hypothetical protein
LCHNTTPRSGAKTPQLCLIVTIVPIQVVISVVVAPSQADFVVVLPGVTNVLIYIPICPVASTAVAVFVEGALQVVMFRVYYPASSAGVGVPLLAVEQCHPFQQGHLVWVRVRVDLSAFDRGNGHLYFWCLPQALLGAMSYFPALLAGLLHAFHGALGHDMVLLLAPVTL